MSKQVKTIDVPLVDFPFKHRIWRDGLERHTRAGQIEIMYRYVVHTPDGLSHIGAVWRFTDFGAASAVKRLFIHQ